MMRISSPRYVWTVFVHFFSEDHLFHPIASPVDDHSIFGKDAQTDCTPKPFGATQDAEWAWTDGKLHIVQSRDITSRSPQRVSRERSTRPETIHRTRSRSPKNEFSEMLPQPTPAVPPEIGGWLSHRANVAREYNVAMIVGTRGLSRVTDGSLL
jgi:phosphoenolpyruvate synthase/pyruvate phosphate dikinase